MKIPGHNQIDSRLALTPRQYLENPSEFGYRSEARFLIPEGGNKVSQILAVNQHRWAVRTKLVPKNERVETQDITVVFAISRQTWNRIINGQTWARQTGIVALEYACRGKTSRR